MIRTKRFLRWVIVLFLLAALPVMTAVMAQGQEPGAPEAPATWNVYESEPNDTRDTADLIHLNDVMGAVMDNDPYPVEMGDEDWFRFTMPEAGNVLIDIDDCTFDEFFQLWLYPEGSNQSLGYVWPCADDAVVFRNLAAGDYYILYIHVGETYSDSSYELILSTPLLVSATAANLGTGNVAGIPFRSEDILAWSDLNNGQERWRMIFDGSDVGVKTLTNVASTEGDELLLSVGKNQTLPGVGAVTPWDIVIFDPSDGQYGGETYGTFRMDFDGSAHQLTTSGEKLDAIAVSQYCDYLSTTGTATVPYYMGYNIKFKDEDLGCWYSDEEWLWGFESRFVTGLPVEDVLAAAYDDSADKMYLTILGNGRIFGHNVTQKDIFAVNWPGYNPNYTWGGLVWHGPDHGWNYNIDAIELNGW